MLFFVSFGAVFLRWCQCPLVCRLGCNCVRLLGALSRIYYGFALLNTSALLEMLDRRVWMDCGILLVMMDGWLYSTWTYKCVFPGLEYGLVSFLFRSKVTSKKSTTVEFALAVICKPICLNFSQSFFLMFSAALGGLWTLASPSSLVEPNVLLGYYGADVPTSSHVSAPSYDPMVTSKRSSVFAFCQGLLLWNRRVFLAWKMISVSDGVMVVNLLAKSMALCSSCLSMEG